jgi:hypothetical protein
MSSGAARCWHLCRLGSLHVLYVDSSQLYEGLHEINASNFLRKCNCNNNGICTHDLCIFFNYGAIFPQSHFLHTSVKVPRLDFGAHDEKRFNSLSLQNDAQVLHPLQEQTDWQSEGARPELWTGWLHWGLSPISVPPLLKFQTQRLDGTLPVHTVEASRNFYGTNFFGGRNSTATFRFILLSITSVNFNCLCVVLMRLILVPLTPQKSETSTIQVVTSVAFRTAEFQRKSIWHYFRTAPHTLI